MSKTKKFSEQLVGGKFFSVVSLEDFVDMEDATIDIEMLRVGTFKHKKYGDLVITEDMLTKMVDNFKNEIVGRDVSFDWNHKAEEASGWLKDLRVENGLLIGTTELTTKGAESIKGKNYGYFSIEYSDDYVDPETEKAYGPTILGGALTNRPFMTKLKKIEFESEGSKDSIYRYEEEKQMDKDKVVERTPVKLTDDEKMLALEAKNTELADKIKALETSAGENKKLQEFIEAQKAALAETQTHIKALQEENKTFKARTDQSESKARMIEIERICDKLLTDDHHHPVIVSMAKQIFMAAPVDKVIKMTETTGEGDAKKEVTLDTSIQDAILRLLAAIPASQRANYKEETKTASETSISEEEQKKLEESAISRSFARKGIKRVK